MIPKATEMRLVNMRTTLGDRLRYERERKGLTQEELANRFKCSRSLINQYETGRKQPKLKNLKRLADILDTTQEFLLDDEVIIFTDDEIKMAEIASQSKLHMQYEVIIGKAISYGITLDDLNACLEFLKTIKNNSQNSK